MLLPEGKYTFDSFLEYILKHPQVIEKSAFRNQLKIYLLYTAHKNWKDFFRECEFQDNYGEFTKITMKYKMRGSFKKSVFFVYQHSDDLILLFTTEIYDVHYKTIRNKISQIRGIDEVWIHPKVIAKINQFIIDKYETAKITNFSSRRAPKDKIPCKIRPDITRRIEYSGEDGKETLKEMKQLYGVIPTSLEYEIFGRIKLKVTEDGLFNLESLNEETFNLFREVFDMILGDIISMKKKFQQIKFDFEKKTIGKQGINIPIVQLGEIDLENIKLEGLDAEEFIDNMSDFSFTDVYIKEGSLIFNATVKDEEKNSIFDISASENKIFLIPKYRTTFESFCKFYRGVTESIDDEATFSLVSESHGC